MSNENTQTKEEEHYQELAGQVMFTRLDDRCVLTVDEDKRGCAVMVEHFHYELSPAVMHVRW